MESEYNKTKFANGSESGARRLQKTQTDTTTKTEPGGCQVGPAGPTPRPAGLGPPPKASGFA